MIKATELRIGNYVYYEDDKHLYDVRALCRDRVHPINIVEHDKNIRWAVDCELDDLKPIPLTPEILESYGFILDGNGNYWKDLISHYLELILGGEDYYYPIYAQVPELSSEAEQRVSLSRIQYLHQLQNLYWCLCGEELEIKL